MSWDKSLLIAKLKALAAHISISIVLVGIALALMLLLWFPPPLFTTDGGGIGLQLLLLVDLVLGPLLTFVVFNPAKARRLMVLDLSVIAVLQLAAYGYGLSSIHSVRVQAVAFHEGVFHAVTAPAFKEQDIAADAWAALGPRAPYLVNTRESANGDEASGVMAFGFTAGLQPYELHFLYQPLAAAYQQAPLRGWTLAGLKATHPETLAAAERWLRKHPKVPADAAHFYRVEGFYGNAVLVLDADMRWRGGFEADIPKLSVFSPSPRS